MHSTGSRGSYSSITAARPLAATLQAVPSSDTAVATLPLVTRQNSTGSSITSSSRRPPKAPATAAAVINNDSTKDSSSSVRHRKSSSASSSVNVIGSSSSGSNGTVGQHGRRSSSTAYHSDVNQALRGVEADMLTSYTRRCV
jgi:hypothetical protein